MSVQTQQFRVVGVNTQTGKDVSVVIDAASKAAAEVKAEKMQIETTHIVRLKQDEPAPPGEHELFSTEAAEALAGKRTINLIEEVITQEDRIAAPPPPPPPPPPAPEPPPPAVVAAITRPNYTAPAVQREHGGAELSGVRAFGIVLLVLFGICAGAYFVLVHQPNKTIAGDEDLIFGQDLFSDVLEDPPAADAPFDKLRDAFNTRADSAQLGGPPISPDQQLQITPKPETADVAPPAEPSKPSKFKLQSVVTTNKGRFAVINGKLYEQGGQIGSATLVSVADDWVLIERDGKQFTLKIESKTSK